MLVHPEINPIAFAFGPLKIHWYGILYLLGFMGFISMGIYRKKLAAPKWSTNELYDLCFYIALGVIFGGRLGMVFYEPGMFLNEPIMLLKFWEPGRSFHGGLLGVIVAILIYSKVSNRKFWDITDFIAPLVPFAIFCGRLGNFINGELVGRVTDVPWAMIFPRVDNLPRHASQLYEALLEGILLFIILWFYSMKNRTPGMVTGIFLLLYGIFRIIAEFFREPDLSVGFIWWHNITMGQILSIPMVLLGVWLLTRKTRG